MGSGLFGGMGSSKTALLHRSYTHQPPKLQGLNGGLPQLIGLTLVVMKK